MALKGTPVPPKYEFAAETSSSSSSSFEKLMTLEVTVLSAEEVVFGERWRRPLDHGAYGVVHTDKSNARTGVNDEKGDCNGYPYWGEAVRVTVSEHANAIDVEIYRRQESVAAASVPVADFSVGPPGHLHCLSYRLFDTRSTISGRNGIVNITVKRLDGAAVPRGEGKGGKTVEDAASGTGDSCCSGFADQGKVPPAAAAAPAGAVMGYPVGLSAAGQAKRAHDVVAGQRTPAPNRRPVLQIRPAGVYNLRHLRQAPGPADPAPLPPLAGRVDREGKRLVQPWPRLQRRRRTRRVVAGGSVPVLWWWSISLQWATVAYGAPGDKHVCARASGLRGGPMAEAHLARGEVAACTTVAGGVEREDSGFDSGEVIRLRRHLPPRCRCLMHPPRRAASPPWSQPPHLNFLPFVSSRASRLAAAA